MDQNNVIRQLGTIGQLVDISVHPHTDVMYCLLFDNTVNTLDRANGYTTKLFVAKGSIFSLAIAKDGNLLVGSFNKPLVTMYSESGTRLQTFKYKGTHPLNISVCMSTGKKVRIISLCVTPSQIYIFTVSRYV